MITDRRHSLAVLVVILLAGSAFANLMVPNGGAIVNIPPPAVDWWARGVSTIAIVISLIALVTGRLDKRREKNAAAAAKLPLVDMHVEKGDIAGDWYFQTRTTNRADVSIELVSIDAGPNFELRSDDVGNGRSHKIVFDQLKIEPGNVILVDGDIHGRFTGHQKIEFTLEYRIFEAVPRTVTKKVTRNL